MQTIKLTKALRQALSDMVTASGKGVEELSVSLGLSRCVLGTWIRGEYHAARYLKWTKVAKDVLPFIEKNKDFTGEVVYPACMHPAKNKTNPVEFQRFMDKHKLNQEEFAEIVGLSASYVSRLLRGLTGMKPDKRKLVRSRMAEFDNKVDWGLLEQEAVITEDIKQEPTPAPTQKKPNDPGTYAISDKISIERLRNISTLADVLANESVNLSEQCLKLNLESASGSLGRIMKCLQELDKITRSTKYIAFTVKSKSETA